jgi:hypothetical protein
VKHLAKLALFFSLSFAIIFVATTGLRFLYLRVDWARTLPPKPETLLTAFIVAARWALSTALYSSLLLSLSYAVREHYFAPMTVICLCVLAICFSFGVMLALDHWESVPPAQVIGKPIGGRGLILSNTLNRNETAIVLLQGAAEPLVPRVVAVPDRPLLFQETAGNADFDLPPGPFNDDTPWFLKSVSIDIRLNAEHLQLQYGAGLFPYLIYAGALIFLLSSLSFTLKISVWPLANLFLGVLAFRGVLSLETFFNSPEMQELFKTFLNNRLPVALVVPVIFSGFGLLVHLYSVLVFTARRRSNDDV